MASQELSRSPQLTETVLSPATVAAIRADLASVADDVVAQIIREVPAYEDAFSGRMGKVIRDAVQVALGGFLSLISDRSGRDVRGPRASAVDGAYQLGRGEVRSGRSTDALLSAYRIGAKVSWQHLAARAVEQGITPHALASFAELVFAYIDELSASSVAGHRDESATEGRARQRMQERLGRNLLAGAPEATVLAAAERAEWSTPKTLTAAIVPESQAGALQEQIQRGTLQVTDLPDLDGAALLLVPDAHGRRRQALLRALAGADHHVGPARDWLAVRTSYDRARRARMLGLAGDTEAHLPRLVLTADPDALDDLRTRALAPLDDVRPATAEKLRETLRAWLLHQGRRDEIAASLFVHPQTVRYRMGQLREHFGDSLDDPDTVLALTLALAVEVAE